MIRINNLEKRYGKRVLFSNFSCEINDGDFVVFNGASGSGKSTLLNMIGGIEPFDSGEIFIDDLNLSKNKDVIRALREKVGFLFQNFALIEEKNVEENLMLVAPRYRTEVSVSEALAKVNLNGYEKRKVYTLSGGEQQRVAIARLFLKKSTIILADEPTGSLDKDNADRIIQYLFELRDTGKTIILVTHDQNLKKRGDYVIDI